MLHNRLKYENRIALYRCDLFKIIDFMQSLKATYTQKNVWGADRKIPRSVMGTCNFPVSGQLLIQFGQIKPVLDQLLIQYGQI